MIYLDKPEDFIQKWFMIPEVEDDFLKFNKKHYVVIFGSSIYSECNQKLLKMDSRAISNNQSGSTRG